MSTGPPIREPHVLLLADRFPPHIGGRASLLRDLVRHLPAERTIVATGPRRGASAADRSAPCEILRPPSLPFGLSNTLRRTRLDRLCRTRRPGLVIASGVEPEGALALGLKERFSIPYALHLEAPELMEIRNEIRAGGETGERRARLLAGTEAILVPSRACWLEAYKLDIHPHHIQVLSPGVDLERFRPGPSNDAMRRKLGAGGGPLVLTMAGDGPAKDLETMLRAFAVARGQQRQATLAVVGASDPKVWSKLLEKLRIEPVVRFVRSVSPDELPDVYRAADAFIAAHREDRDSWILAGVEITLLEALASGLPIVGTRVPATEELVGNEGAAILVESGAHVKLGKALLDVLRPGEIRDDLRARARQRAEDTFEARECARAFREFLEVLYHRRLGLGTLPDVPAAVSEGTARPAA